MQYIVQKRGHRVLPMIALVALLGLALLVGIMNVSAGHKGNLIELDVHLGAIGTCTTPFATSGLCDDANTFDNVGVTGFDWEDVCTTYSAAGITPIPAGKFANDIVRDATPPSGVSVSDCLDDYHKGSGVTGGDHTYFDQDKDIHDVSGTTDAWGCVDQSQPTPKDEILNASAIHGVAPSGSVVAGHTILYYNLERGKNEGTAFNGVWFMQAGASCSNDTNAKVAFSGGPHVSACKDQTPPDPALDCPGTTTQRRGDILVLSNYTGGGRVASVKVGEWSVGGPTDPCPFGTRVDTNICQIAVSGDCANEGTGITEVPDTDVACAVVNTREFKVTPAAGELALAPWNNECVPAGKIKCNSGTRVDLGTNQFFEGSLDLTQLLCISGGVPIPGCEVPCLSTFLAETRSSAQFDATLKDFVRGDFPTCKTAFSWEKVDQHTPATHLAGAEFQVTPNPLGTAADNCPDPSPPPTFLVDCLQVTDCATTPAACPSSSVDRDPNVGVFCVQGVVTGTYTIHESVVPTGFIGAADQTTNASTAGLTTNKVCPVTPTSLCPTTSSPTAQCIFVNHQGSLIIRKEHKDARTTATDDLLGGATFQVTPNPLGTAAANQNCPDGLTPPGFLPNCLQVTDNGTGDFLNTTAGLICINNVTTVPGSYAVTETGVPANHAGAAPQSSIKAVGDSCATRTAVRIITSNSAANPTVVTTSADHHFSTGNKVQITGVTGSVPSINGTFTATVIDATHFSIPVNVTTGGTGGTVTAAPDVTFVNTPLSEIEIIFRSLAGGVPIAGAVAETVCDGNDSDPGDSVGPPVVDDDNVVDDGCSVTKAQIVCVDASPAETADDGGVIPGDQLGEDGAADGTTTAPVLDDYNEVFTGLVPDVYTCTIVIDP